jgi:hypothetical protein
MEVVPPLGGATSNFFSNIPGKELPLVERQLKRGYRDIKNSLAEFAGLF